MKHSIWLICLIIPFLFGCKTRNNSRTNESNNTDSTFTHINKNARIIPEYAKGFNVTYTNKGYCLRDIRDPQKE